MRRNRAGAIAALVLLAALLAGAGGAIWQGIRAERSRAIAAARFDDARKLTDSLLFDFYQSVQKLDGSERAKRLLVQWTRETLENLARQSGTNGAVRGDLANTYLQLGKLQASSGGAEPPQWTEAMASYDRGLLLLEPVLAKEPGSRQALLGRAHLLEARSEAEKALGRLQDSARDAGFAREILSRKE